MPYLIAVLAVSLFANVAAVLGYLGQRDELTKAGAGLKFAQSETESCRKGVSRLGELADIRAAEAAPARAAAAAVAVRQNQRADKILSTPASAAGNDCQSARDRAAAWLAGRAAP